MNTNRDFAWWTWTVGAALALLVLVMVGEALIVWLRPSRSGWPAKEHNGVFGYCWGTREPSDGPIEWVYRAPDGTDYAGAVAAEYCGEGTGDFRGKVMTTDRLRELQQRSK